MMLDGNISAEEDTELRDLVMQTLENNGVLAKVRAKLRASVFLALEEQETVMNPVPLLNTTVKQYLMSSEGKLLFSLVREFLEYFGLDYTMSVYDPETYNGKEYNYIGRNKLCEELGINSTEPILGEILKNTINSAFNNTKKNDVSNNISKQNLDSPPQFSNSTFDISVPKILQNENIIDIDSQSNKHESIQEDSDLCLPINETISTDKQLETLSADASMDISISETQNSVLREIELNKCLLNDNKICNNRETHLDIDTNKMSDLNKTESLIKFDESVSENTKKEDLSTMKIARNRELHITNNRNILGKTTIFDDIIKDEKKEKIENAHKNEQLFNELPSLKSNANSIFSNLPPLNGKNDVNINDVKEIVDRVADGLDNYDEDFSSPSVSTNEQSPLKEPDKSDSLQMLLLDNDEISKSQQSKGIGEEIKEILTSTSCLDSNAANKIISKITDEEIRNYYYEDI